MKKDEQKTEIEILVINRGRARFAVKGTAPLICNRMSEKAKQQLLMPRGKLSSAEKQSNLKHLPLEEFRASPYIDRDPRGPTLIQVLASSFKGAMKTAALDLPGASKAQISRLVWTVGDRIAIYGVPQLFMSVTRSADQNKTPDVRTRAIIPQWAAIFEVAFATPILKDIAVQNLVMAAGLMQGIGDWRAGKGSGSYGTFEIVNHDDKEFKAILKAGDRKAQEKAMAHPVFYDSETEELFAWFESETKRRGFKTVELSNGSARTHA